jgi:hypothetical protein
MVQKYVNFIQKPNNLTTIFNINRMLLDSNLVNYLTGRSGFGISQPYTLLIRRLFFCLFSFRGNKFLTL